MFCHCCVLPSQRTKPSGTIKGDLNLEFRNHACMAHQVFLRQVRDELRDEISGLHQRKLEEESELAEASEQVKKHDWLKNSLCMCKDDMLQSLTALVRTHARGNSHTRAQGWREQKAKGECMEEGDCMYARECLL